MSKAMTSIKTAGSIAPVLPVRKTALQPLGLEEIVIEGGYWADRQALNRDAMIPHCLYWEHKEGWINNFSAQLRGTLAAERRGREFSDSDVYKLLEAITWELGREPNPELEDSYNEIVELIAQCQQPDGYLNTKYGNPGQRPRYVNLEMGHELYNFGHLMQAAVARLRIGRGQDDLLVQIALRAADHVCEMFGPLGIQSVGGHPEIEVALVELYRATGTERYLKQASLFIERRGRGVLKDFEFGRSYFQDDIPVREATVLRGHAVRALYLSAGAIDAGVELDDTELVDAIELQYQNTLARRTYITGGMGSHHQDEAFGSDFELPPDRAYCETCAGIASVMVAWRLLLARGDIRYADVIERTLYNIVAVSPAEDGKAFFYANPLHKRVEGQEMPDDVASLRASDSGRAAWFNVSCCPTNVSRTFAQLGTYIATTSARGVQLLQYVSGTIKAQLADGSPVILRVTTDYPHDGAIRIEVLDAPTTAWELTVRIPAWAQGATAEVNGESQSVAAPSLILDDVTPAGTVIELNLPLEPRWSYPDERIDAIRGCVALEKGPLVYCAESVDQVDRADVEVLRVDPTQSVKAEGHRLIASGWHTEFANSGSLYGLSAQKAERKDANITYIPYYTWANRGPSTMRIWVPTE